MTFDRMPVACLAPVLTDEMLARYEVLAAEQGGEIGDAMAECLQCVQAWWQLPESKLTGKKFTAPNGTFTVTPLEAEHVASLDAVTPWPRNLDAMKPLFELLSGEVRDAAFMLLWYALELAHDREPTTQDKLKVL